MFRKYVFVLLALSLVLLPIKAYSAVDDPFWPQSEYDKIESRILDNVPVITDDATSYKFTVVDADGTRKEITYSVNLTDSQFAPYVRTSVEEYYTARPGGAAGSLIVRDNVEDWTWAIRAALDHVANYTNPSGIKGGTVVLPTRAAPYITGAIRFRGDNTRIHLEDGVTINFIRNLRYGTDVRAEPTTMLPPIAPTNYDDWYPQEKTRYECRDIYGFSPLIYAYKLKNIALTGSGRGGDNPVTGDGRNGTEDGSITPEAGSKLSIIDGRADGRNMRISSGPTGPLYLPDNVTSLGTPGTFNMNNTTGEPVVSGGVSYSTYVTNRMNAWEPISSRKIPDLLTASLASADLMQSIAMRRVNRYRPTFIEPHESQNVLISNFYMRNSPFWTVHPEYSNNVRVTGLHINSHGGNNDGCNPDSSQYVLIEGNIFNTGDDCIAIKCGRDNDAYQDWNMSSNHIIVRNNLMFDGHGGLVAGSEMGGGVEWVFSHNNKYDSPYLYWGLRIKTTSNRGGFVRNIYMKDTEAHALEGGLVKLNFYYEADSDNRVPSISDIYISNFSTPATGFTAPPNLGFLTGKQYGSSPINGIHFKDCDFRGFRQSPNSPNHPNRPVNNVICAVEGGITYDNVLIDGEPYQPPAKSSTIKSLLFTRTGTSDIREVTNDEELKAIIDESRNASGMNWDIAIVAKVEGFDYKGKRYNIFDTIENSTFTDSWAGSNHAYRNSLTGTNDGPNLRYADSQYPYYRVNGMPAYEAFVRVGSNSPFADWYVTSGTWDGGPCYVIDLRMPGRVIPMGNNEYLIKLRENVNMGTNTPGRVTGFNALNKVEIILRNALYPEDQDFVFYSHIPRIKATSINVDKKLFTVTFDRPMNTPEYLALLAPLDYKLNSDGSIVPIGYVGQWSADGTSVSYSIPGTIDASKRYTIDAFDPTSKVLSYRGVVPVLSGTAIISLTLNADYILMKAGETFQLVPTIFPSDATLPITYAFTSDNVNVAGVSNSGLVTARAAGSAKITVKASNDGGEATATFNVIVTDPLSDDSSVTPIPGTVGITIGGANYPAILQNDGSYLIQVP
ncbi:MAG: glycosyl hydrolase family 28 protein, partial [Oscillospiraceae bacterium]|nr:glycosyl hydrolase family 28 protein [Oscillospiraceae bacterium]